MTFNKLTVLKTTVIRGLNPGQFTLQGTNTYLVGKGPNYILIDTGQGVSGYEELLYDALKDGKPQKLDVLCTHRHLDHVGGIHQVMRVVDRLNEASAPHKCVMNFYKRVTEDSEQKSYLNINNGQEFCVEGASVGAIYTPGHTNDHVSFLLKEENAVFSGDCVLGQGSAVFENLTALMHSLQTLLGLAPRRIYPGHGPIVEDAQATIQQYISHRNEREKQIVTVLSAQEWMTATQIVNSIYKGYPESILSAAEKSVILHLEKLEIEQIATRREMQWRIRK